MRSAIDQGRPLNDLLINLLFTTSAVLRCFVGLSSASFGSNWLECPEALIEVLEHIHPERRPKTEASWGKLRALVNAAEKKLERRSCHSFYIRAWLRERMHEDSITVDSISTMQIGTGLAASVDALWENLQLVLAGELGLHASDHTNRIPRVIRITAGKWLMQYKLRRLVLLDKKFNEQLEQARQEDSGLKAFTMGVRYWPLIPSDFVSTSCSRRVSPLIDATQLTGHGKVMQICLGNSIAYHQNCRAGRAFIVAFYDESDNPVSTAELTLKSASDNTIQVEVVQHTGFCNAAVSRNCSMAMTELQSHINNKAVQAHLRLGLLAKGYLRTASHFAINRVELRSKTRAIQMTFGEDAWNALVQQCHTALALVHERQTKECFVL